MTLRQCRAALTALAAIAAAALIAPSYGQTPYPSQGIRFIIPAGAGGLPDTVARIVARRLQEKAGQPVVVENRAGGNGAVAVSALLSLPADGHSFIIQDGSIWAINPHIYARMAYNVADLTPAAMVARAPLFLAVHEKVPVTSMQQLIDHVRARPGQLNYGSSGVGSTHHLSMLALASALDLKMTHVPFKGTSESVPALLGGHIEVLFAAYPNLASAVATGKVRMLATSGAVRAAAAPDVPPVGDFVPGFDFAPRIGLYARTGTPDELIERIAALVVEIAREPEVAKLFATAGIEPAGAGPAEFRAALQRESDLVARTVKAAGIKTE